jgi:hypothetical protein
MIKLFLCGDAFNRHSVAWSEAHVADLWTTGPPWAPTLPLENRRASAAFSRVYQFLRVRKTRGRRSPGHRDRARLCIDARATSPSGRSRKRCSTLAAKLKAGVDPLAQAIMDTDGPKPDLRRG